MNRFVVELIFGIVICTSVSNSNHLEAPSWLNWWSKKRQNTIGLSSSEVKLIKETVKKSGKIYAKAGQNSERALSAAFDPLETWSDLEGHNIASHIHRS